jgi:heterodisulfide reductase subunit C
MTDSTSWETIDNDAIDRGFADEIVKSGVDRIRTCIQCGVCTSVCPSGRHTAFKTRELMRKAVLGLKDEVLSSEDLWMCSTCYTCLERCPRKIRITDAIISMRNMAVDHGFMLPEHKKASQKLLSTGHAVPIDDANQEIRKDLGLQELPPTTHSNKKALKQVQEILKRTGFKDLVESQKLEGK